MTELERQNLVKEIVAKTENRAITDLIASMKACEDTYEETQALWAEIDFQAAKSGLSLRRLKLLRPRLDDIERKI